jgi:osmoprotectant transport system ATP-binding protein
MLMDEPFGAIDPITRERLQDEFLRLQTEIRKTIVFVTHDIDEAIKMGDRIAVLREGGILAQYATPDELLTSPADDFVARFVGTDRSLKRLSLSTVGELDLMPADGYERNGRPQLGHDTSLRDALALILSHGGEPLAVVDENGRVTGLVSTELISGVLS